MNLLLIFGILIFHIYLIWYRINYKPEFSISNTYYGLPKNINWLFTIFSWGYGIPIAIVSVNLLGTPLMFFAGVAIAFVGTAANFRESDLACKVHMEGAKIAIILSQLSLIFEFKMWYMCLASFILGGLVYFLGKKKLLFKDTYIYWAEIIMIETIFGVLVYNLW